MNAFRRLLASLLSSLLAFIQIPVHAAIAIRAPGIPEAEFRGLVKARSEWVSLSRALLRSAPDPLAVEKLHTELEHAQRAFLGERTSAITLEMFIGITQMAYEDDWNPGQRQAIHYAFMRAAQLTQAQDTRKIFLDSAIAFAPDFTPDKDLFPPPLIAEFSLRAEELRSKAIHIDLKRHFSGFQIVRLNGRVYHPLETETILLFPGKHRLTALSDAYLPQSRILNTAQVLEYQPLMIPIADGSCDQPRVVSNPLPVKGTTVFIYSPDCIQSLRDGNWKRIVSRSARQTDDSLYGEEMGGRDGLDLVPERPQPHLNETQSNWSEIRAPQKPLYRKPWFWIGVATVVSAYFIHEYQTTNRNTMPNSDVRPVDREMP